MTNREFYADILRVVGLDDRQVATVIETGIPFRLPGGCDQCDAYQQLHLDAYMVNIVVHHDDDCPFLLEHEQRIAARRAS